MIPPEQNKKLTHIGLKLTELLMFLCSL